jgi:hypothetical protein
MVTFPAPSLKFRTLSFPQSGFKPRCPNQPRPSREVAKVKRQIRMPSVTSRFDVVFVASTPSCVTRLAFSTSPPRALSSNHLGPRALCSERVIVSPSSPLLRPDPPVSPAPPDFPSSLVIQAAFARRSGLGCRRDLPCFGSVLLPHVPSPLRREESQGPIPAGHPVSIAFLNKAMSRLLQHSQHRLPSGPIVSARKSGVRAATARVVACPPVPIRPEDRSPAAEDFYPELSREKVTLPTSRGLLHGTHGVDTVAGLSPAGTLPLQAARFVDGLQGFGFPTPCRPATGLLTLTPVGLSPTEHVSLSWTHNLTCLSRLLRILRFHAHDLNLKPSRTVYMRWGKGPKQRLRFTKTGDPRIEEAYATHFVWPGKGPFHPPASKEGV